MLKENLENVEQKIQAACERSGRDRSEVTLIAVSKTKPAEMVQEAYDLGIRLFGENKVQEIMDKSEVLPADIHWHMIGHLQRNKIKYIIDKVDLIHSVDSLRLAEAIEKEAAKKHVIAKVLIEVNVGREESKFGFLPEELDDFVEKASDFSHIQFMGLMTSAPFVDNPEENRPIFTGCLFEIANNKLNVVAVDGFRLAWKSKFLQNKVNNFSAVIPGRTLNEINKILIDSFDMIKIGVAKNQVLFEMENCKIVTRLLDGEFLNYSSVIPETWETRVRVNKSILQDCFERVSLISASSIEKEKKYPVKVTVDIGKVTISCTNQTGDAKEEIYVSTEGKNLEAGFNPKYFLDALRNIDDEEIFVDFGTSISPCIIRPVDEEGDYTYMILPIKLKD